MVVYWYKSSVPVNATKAIFVLSQKLIPKIKVLEIKQKRVAETNIYRQNEALPKS